MPRRNTGKGPSDRFNIRLDEATADFYRRKANEGGITISEYLRQILVQGVVAENVVEIDARLRGVIAQINALGIPLEVTLSIFTSEQLLTAIVEARDIQELYAAQDRAKARLNRLRA